MISFFLWTGTIFLIALYLQIFSPAISELYNKPLWEKFTNMCLLLWKSYATRENFFQKLIRSIATLTIKHQVLGSPLTGRDLLIGFDLLHQISSLRWSSKGLIHKQHLLTWTQVPHLFTMDPFDSLKLQIINDCCASSHSEFLLKNPDYQ